MTEYYFDIETYSKGNIPNPDTDKIISIQFQKLDSSIGKPIGGLQILKEWESSEESIIIQFFPLFKQWDFIPVGMNLTFEREFLISKFKKYINSNITSREFYYNFPSIDVQPILVLLNGGNFKGAKLNAFTNKKQDGSKIREWYENKEFNKIEEYIKQESKSFIEFYQKIKKNIKSLIE